MNSNVSIVVAFAAGIALTWWVEGMRWDKDVSSLKESYALALKAISDKAVVDLAAANQRTAEAQAAAAELDKRHTEELAHAMEQNQALRDDVAAGTRRVRIAATCPKRDGTTSSSATGLDDVTAPRLTKSAERDYWNLRERASIATKQIEGLQDYIKEVCR